MIRYDEGQGIFIPDIFSNSGIDAGFSSRSPLPVHDIVMARQVHDTTILAVDAMDTRPGPVDALMTHHEGIRIGVRTADCVPIVYADIRLRVVAASHQGWKGTLEGLAPKVVRMLMEQGSHLQDIRVAIGPAIGACCYRMYGERKQLFDKSYPQFSTVCTCTGEDTTYFDLARLNYLQLLAMGVTSSQIDRGVYYTACDDQRFFSYQREGTGCGHMTSYIMVKENQ